jgi:nucleolar complex protein 3
LGNAEVDLERKKKTQLQLLEKVFLMYFRILKEAKTSPLIPAVLEGLSK